MVIVLDMTKYSVKTWNKRFRLTLFAVANWLKRSVTCLFRLLSLFKYFSAGINTELMPGLTGPEHELL